jgi:hypothetical protein
MQKLHEEFKILPPEENLSAPSQPR